MRSTSPRGQSDDATSGGQFQFPVPGEPPVAVRSSERTHGDRAGWRSGLSGWLTRWLALWTGWWVVCVLACCCCAGSGLVASNLPITGSQSLTSVGACSGGPPLPSPSLPSPPQRHLRHASHLGPSRPMTSIPCRPSIPFHLETGRANAPRNGRTNRSRLATLSFLPRQ